MCCAKSKESTNLFVQDWTSSQQGFQTNATAPVDYILDCLQFAALACSCVCLLQSVDNKETPVEVGLGTRAKAMAADPAPYQHRNLSQFIPDNHNIGLTDEKLVMISTKEFNRLLKNSGKCEWRDKKRRRSSITKW